MRREQRSIDVGHLLEAAGEELAFTCLSDWGGLDREIAATGGSKSSGLALSGFVRHVYGDRVQVLGLTEIDYLMSCEPDSARAGLEQFCAKDISCMILTRGLEPPEVLMEVANAHGVLKVIQSTLMSSTMIGKLTRFRGGARAPGDHPRGAPRRARGGVAAQRSQRRRQERGGAGADLEGAPAGRGRRGAWLFGHRTRSGARPRICTSTDMEIRGMGILNITHFGVGAVRDTKKVEVVVELSDLHEDDYDRLGMTESSTWPILGIDVPLVRILRAGRNIASLIEVVARNQLLKLRGHDSAREFQDMVSKKIAAGDGAAHIE